MKIGLDVRYLSHGLTGGVRTYVYHLARELPLCAPHHQFFYYADDKAPLELEELPANVTLRMASWRGTLHSIRNDFQFGRLMEEDGLDVAHCPGNYGPVMNVPLVTTVHDALNLFSMSQHLRGFGRSPRQVAMMAYLGHMTRLSLIRAERVITVSEHARQDIASRNYFPLERIATIYEAAGDEFSVVRDRALLADARQRFELWPRFVLGDGIKNPVALIEAYRALPKPLRASTQLVFFSRESAPRQPVADALASPMVKFIARPSTSDLVLLMNLASVFAFPSWFEGFGLPLVEAMGCGTAIVGSSRGSIPEVVGDAGLTADLETPGAFGDALRTMLEDEVLRKRFANAALARAKRFTWQRAARETLNVYEQVVSERRRTA
jgi:glycosyltransferase involved in cell wall biosynthesis